MMDENQLRYQRLYNYTDDELQYKQYRIVIEFPTYAKRIIVRACCKEEIKDSTKENILSIKLI
jgi:hypothetical protein